MALATRNAFKSYIIVKLLLLTRDVELEEEAAMAAKSGCARLLLARTVGEALQIVCERSRELDLVVIDFDNTRGMTLLSALGTSCADLPIVVLTSRDGDHAGMPDGAACCLTKPMNIAELQMVIRRLGKSKIPIEPAWSKGESSYANR